MIAFRNFNASLPRHAFDCGNAALNMWFLTQAGQHERSNSARTHLGLHTFDSRIASFFCLVSYRLELDQVEA